MIVDSRHDNESGWKNDIFANETTSEIANEAINQIINEVTAKVASEITDDILSSCELCSSFMSSDNVNRYDYGVNGTNDFSNFSESNKSEGHDEFNASEEYDVMLIQNDYHQDDDYESDGDFSLKEIKRRNLNEKDEKRDRDQNNNQGHKGNKDHKDHKNQKGQREQKDQVSQESSCSGGVKNSNFENKNTTTNNSANKSLTKKNSRDNSHSKFNIHTTFPVTKVEMMWNGKKLILETGRIAKQASSVYITYGGTSILCSVAFGYPLHDIDFLPLNVVYQEKSFAIGKIPNGFIKRETKPSDNEVLISRIIDRSIRPLFSHFLRNDIQIICDVKDYDGETDTAVISVIGASAALMISGLPISECIACAKVGKIDNTLKVHNDNNKAGGVNLFVSGGRGKVFMIECESNELSENEVMDAIQMAINNFQPVLDKIHEFADSAASAMSYYVENKIPENSVFKSKLFQHESNVTNSSELCDMSCEDIFEDKFFLSVKHVMFRKIYDILVKKCGGMNFFELSNDRRKKIIHYTKYGLDISNLVHEFLTSKNFHGHSMNSKKNQNDQSGEDIHNSDNNNNSKNADEGDDCDYALADHEHAIKNALNHAFLSICVKEFERRQAHEYIFKKRVRLDGRKLNEIRDLDCETGVLKHSHGSAIFTRGMTQSFASVVVGLQEDSQVVDDIFGERRERFMLHYNFPPFAVGDTGRMSAPGRREIGHGNLAKKAFSAVLPRSEKFPYTVRAVSDITESDGSSSMASICSVNAALVNAGVPIESNVAGIAMGLLMRKAECTYDKINRFDKLNGSEGYDKSYGSYKFDSSDSANMKKDKLDDYIVLTDILGNEDALGDMDFKIAGTEKGITALQMDIKCSGVSLNVLRDALSEGGVAYRKVLDVLNNVKKVNFDESKILTRVHVGKDRIREVIGVGGRVVKDICQKTGSKLSVQDSVGEVLIFGHERARNAAEKMIKNILNRCK